jgi:hypothetical protein
MTAWSAVRGFGIAVYVTVYFISRPIHGLRTILKNLNLLGGHETARHHAIKYGQERVDLFLCVDDLDHNWQILREAQDLRGMNVARMAEPDMSPQDRSTAKSHLARLQYNRLVERQVIEFVIFAEENTEQHGIAGNLHVHIHFIVLMLFARM